MLLMAAATPPVREESLRAGPHATSPPAVADLISLDVLEPSGSQWAIALPDGRVIPTGTDQARTERDADWENTNPQGRGGCSALVCDGYRTPWRRAGDPAPVVVRSAEASVAQEAEIAALHSQVAELVDLMRYYRHLAAEQVRCPLPTTQSQDWASRHRRLQPARSQSRVSGPQAS